MVTIKLSEEDAEYIEFLLDDLMVRNANRIKDEVEFVTKAHQQYSLGQKSREVDSLYIEAVKQGLEFIKDLRQRFIDAREVDND